MPAARLSVDEVVARVSDRLYDGPLEPTFEGAKPSAVLAVLADGPAGAEVLLTRRAQHLRNHRGEVSFPGGRVDPGETYPQAALREAYEEVGLAPATVEVVGSLEPLSTLVSQSWIVPVLARIPEPVTLVGQPGEVERVLWVPLHDLTRPGTFREELWTRPGGEWPIMFFELDDETVWGATARMLYRVLRLAHQVESPEPFGF